MNEASKGSDMWGATVTKEIDKPVETSNGCYKNVRVILVVLLRNKADPKHETKWERDDGNQNVQDFMSLVSSKGRW